MDNEIQKAIDYLTQVSYNEQRKLFPNIPAKDWGLVYGKKEVALMEKSFQKSLTTSQK